MKLAAVRSIVNKMTICKQMRKIRNVLNIFYQIILSVHPVSGRAVNSKNTGFVILIKTIFSQP